MVCTCIPPLAILYSIAIERNQRDANIIMYIMYIMYTNSMYYTLYTMYAVCVCL